MKWFDILPLWRCAFCLRYGVAPRAFTDAPLKQLIPQAKQVQPMLMSLVTLVPTVIGQAWRVFNQGISKLKISEGSREKLNSESLELRWTAPFRLQDFHLFRQQTTVPVQPQPASGDSAPWLLSETHISFWCTDAATNKLFGGYSLLFMSVDVNVKAFKITQKSSKIWNVGTLHIFRPRSWLTEPAISQES